VSERTSTNPGIPRPPSNAGTPRPPSNAGTPRPPGNAGTPRPPGNAGTPRRAATAGTLAEDVVVAAGAYFEVLERRVQTVAAGEPQQVVHTMRMPDWVSVVAVTQDGHFVLVRQHRFGVDAETLETPGGIVDEGEDPASTALRELVEETGYTAERAEPLGWVHPNPAIQDNRFHMFLVRGACRVSEPKHHVLEHTEPVVLDRAALDAAMRDGTISHALALLALERGLGRIAPVSAARAALRRATELVGAMEETQRGKVLELARRLRPDLTAEDIRNPHDFPDLDDPDWHFEDGQLAGIEAVRFALHGLTRDLFSDEESAPQG